MKQQFLGLLITDWLCIIGAFAWLPQIIKWIKEYFKKPKLTIVSGEQIEIGFTSFGPIINLSLAFLSETKKALIHKLVLELVHENNDTQKFSWVWFEEILYSMDLPDLQQINTKRNQNAIAVKIGIDELIEKKIGFQQNTFKHEYNKLYKQLSEDAIEFYQIGKNSDELKLTSAYRNLSNLLTDSFNWKTGKYKVKITTYISNDKIIVHHELDFALNSLDLKLLHSNIENCQLNLEKTFINNEIGIRPWQWVNTSKLLNHNT
jgi:hypothetical protein